GSRQHAHVHRARRPRADGEDAEGHDRHRNAPHGAACVPPEVSGFQASKSGAPPSSAYASPARKSEPVTRTTPSDPARSRPARIAARGDSIVSTGTREAIAAATSPGAAPRR